MFSYAAMTPKAIIDAAVDRITENKFFFSFLLLLTEGPEKLVPTALCPLTCTSFVLSTFQKKFQEKYSQNRLKNNWPGQNYHAEWKIVDRNVFMAYILTLKTITFLFTYSTYM